MNPNAPSSTRPPLPKGDRNMNPQGIGFWALVREDFLVHGKEWFSQGFWTLFWHRFGNWRMGLPGAIRPPFTLLYRVMHKACEVFAGIMLPYNIPVGRRVKLEHFGGIIVSARSIGNDVTLRQNTTLGVARADDTEARPTLEDGVDVGVGVAILGNVTVGRGSVIGANAVVTKDVAPRSVAVGIPAKVIKTLETQPSSSTSPEAEPAQSEGLTNEAHASGREDAA